ncbi:hypothetical protein NLI96_g10270 [Meripilus lineatus]|uniref:NEDD8-activating enzyme E1 regulatory subunit n=1 Tax=Meripilus lineatus TaxID=2056292 RepID=A0AAD5UYJ5_9APHY|nr:hypothetical protein NLI96_g10270 [Physisporinus lineatus]
MIGSFGMRDSIVHTGSDQQTIYRLWAASGQSALESSRILMLSSSATSTAIMKNLVLPGIGHFTLLDSTTVQPADAGNNFFLNGFLSVGKSRAEEALPLLNELNDSVNGAAVVKSVEQVLETEEGREWIRSFTLVIAHNPLKGTLETLSRLLWEDPANPPLMVVRSAGFLADFYIQFHEHCIIEPHSETAPSLRLTKPFPALQQWADSLDYKAVDPTEHAHIPFVVILIKEADKWRAEHDGNFPKTSAEKDAFKARIRALQLKLDEENFEEAEAQAVRLWREVGVPSDISSLFSLSPLEDPPQAPSSQQAQHSPSHSVAANGVPRQQHNAIFHALLRTLEKFVADPEGSGCLPLTSTLPDMKTDTESYVKLQRLYKNRSREENARFKELLKVQYPDLQIDESLVDLFVKNAHHIKLLRGKRWGAWEEDRASVGSALEFMTRETATHLALSALSTLQSKGIDVTVGALTAEIQQYVGLGVELPGEVEVAVGEVARSPTADLPNTAAFLGGMIAQEAIKMITKQYVPVNGYCVVDLVDTWTGIVGQ